METQRLASIYKERASFGNLIHGKRITACYNIFQFWSRMKIDPGFRESRLNAFDPRKCAGT